MVKLPFQIVGFDLDGTLLDTAADLGAAVNHALALVGRAAIPPAQVSALIGGGSRLMLGRALELTGDIRLVMAEQRGIERGKVNIFSAAGQFQRAAQHQP